MSVAENGIFVLWRLLPHGFFELFAVFISLGMGLKIGGFIFQKKKINFLRDNFLNSFKVFLFIIIPLLIIAAIIESLFIFVIGYQ
jgi:uncharacterized membrane protein SpoIIM required for sporulation